VSSIALESLRRCFEGSVPAMLATCAPDGTPNVAYASQVHYVDAGHVALSFQFFSKTRENILANPQATVYVTHPETVAQYLLQLRYLRTEDSGPVFESMRARLAGIASHTGMAGVFRLRGSDIYEVLAIERVPGPELPLPARACDPLHAVRGLSQRLAAQADLGSLLDALLAGLREFLGIEHAMVLLADARRRRLFTVASLGYASSGVGSEIPYGEGVIGVAAQHATPIRINHLTQDLSYSRAVRAETLAQAGHPDLDTEIPLPGLAESRSQLAVPIVIAGRIAGVLYAESPQELRFGHEDEDVLVALAAQLGMAIAVMLRAESPDDVAPAPSVPVASAGAPCQVRHFASGDSVFLDDAYLIKGVAGAIFVKLVREHLEHGRTEFTNRELRLTPELRLPDISDNLEARLILLQRRLAERDACVQIAKCGRGRFQLIVRRPLRLSSA
jgi:GNAT superfamily N-acetyltransferase